MARIKIPSSISGGLLLSYQCSAACRHCIYSCSPQWHADWISHEDLELCISNLAGRIQPSPYGPDAIGLSDGLHFSGGEPFLNFDLLVKAVDLAEQAGIPSTFVETNCFWCRKDSDTREMLRLLKNKGLKGILISVNPFYAEYVPFERTERCIRLSSQIFPDTMAVYQMEYYHQFKRLGIKDKISLEDFTALTNDSDLTHSVEMFLMGRATYMLREFYPSYPAQTFFTMPCQPPFLRNWHNHFDNYGNIMPGFCSGISLGSWKELDLLVETGEPIDDQPILQYLLNEDMQGLFQFAGDFGYQESPGGYISKCDLCLDIRKFLFSKKNFRELRPKEFYKHAGS